MEESAPYAGSPAGDAPSEGHSPVRIIPLAPRPVNGRLPSSAIPHRVTPPTRRAAKQAGTGSHEGLSVHRGVSQSGVSAPGRGWDGRYRLSGRVGGFRWATAAAGKSECADRGDVTYPETAMGEPNSRRRSPRAAVRRSSLRSPCTSADAAPPVGGCGCRMSTPARRRGRG